MKILKNFEKKKRKVFLLIVIVNLSEYREVLLLLNSYWNSRICICFRRKTAKAFFFYLFFSTVFDSFYSNEWNNMKIFLTNPYFFCDNPILKWIEKKKRKNVIVNHIFFLFHWFLPSIKWRCLFSSFEYNWRKNINDLF